MTSTTVTQQTFHGFLSLPAELQLDIVSFALEPKHEFGLSRRRGGPRTYFVKDESHSAPVHLSILLVCRQFRERFTELAWKKTVFFPWTQAREKINRTPDILLRCVRKMIVDPYREQMASWETYPFNTESLTIDHLTVVNLYKPPSTEAAAIARMLRRLKNVKVIEVLLGQRESVPRLMMLHFIRALQEEDQYQRYTTGENRPNVGNTWWAWDLDMRTTICTFTAKEPLPLMEKEEYMRLMQPELDAARDDPVPTS